MRVLKMDEHSVDEKDEDTTMNNMKNLSPRSKSCAKVSSDLLFCISWYCDYESLLLTYLFFFYIDEEFIILCISFNLITILTISKEGEGQMGQGHFKTFLHNKAVLKVATKTVAYAT